MPSSVALRDQQVSFNTTSYKQTESLMLSFWGCDEIKKINTLGALVLGLGLVI